MGAAVAGGLLLGPSVESPPPEAAATTLPTTTAPARAAPRCRTFCPGRNTRAHGGGHARTGRGGAGRGGGGRSADATTPVGENLAGTRALRRADRPLVTVAEANPFAICFSVAVGPDSTTA
jgi:hypothetical protein